MKAQTPSLPPEIQALRQSIADVAKRHGVESIRLFGSALQGLERARDVDLVIDPMPPSFDGYSILVQDLEKLFGKPVDLCELRKIEPGALASEIGAKSVALFQSEKGRDRYAEAIDRLLALTEDQRLSFPSDLRKKSLQDANRRLRGT